MATTRAASTELTHDDVNDEKDSAVKAPGPDLSGKRVRAIPAKGGTTVVVRRADFKQKGIDHGDVTFDFRKDRFTLSVGNKDGQLSEKAADFLTKNYPESFEYLSE